MRDAYVATAMKSMMQVSCEMNGKLQPKCNLNLKAVLANIVKSVMGVLSRTNMK